MKKIISTILIIFMIFIVGCTSDGHIIAKDVVEHSKEIKTYKVGVLLPLSGDAAVIGEPAERVQSRAIQEINEKWAKEGKNKRIELIFEDGKCNSKDGLNAAQKLINLDNVKIILGGGCSGETMGAAPFAEANKVIMLSSISTAPEITNAGDYIFRNIGGDDSQIITAAKHLKDNGYNNIAILTENTNYGQNMRIKLKEEAEKLGINIVSDEIISSDGNDFKTNILKIKKANPDVIFINPQNPNIAKVIINNINDMDIGNIMLYGTEYFSIEEFIEGLDIKNMITFRHKFDTEKPEFKTLAEETDCNLGFYCATMYDSVLLIAEAIDACGEDTDCIKTKFYNTKNWVGKYQGEVSFDMNGDIKGEFDVYKIINGKLILQ